MEQCIVDKNKFCTLKLRVKCGREENEDDLCGCFYKDCKILFKNYEELESYRQNIDKLLGIVANNGLIDNPDHIRDVVIVRALTVNEDKWESLMNSHAPGGLTWQTATDEQKMMYISKFLNRHPYRTQFNDPVYPCM